MGVYLGHDFVEVGASVVGFCAGLKLDECVFPAAELREDAAVRVLNLRIAGRFLVGGFDEHERAIQFFRRAERQAPRQVVQNNRRLRRQTESEIEILLRGLGIVVQKGVGSFITMEFGEPELRIEEPRPWNAHTSGGDRHRTMRRLASVYGEWHLWIYCCEWTLEADGIELAWCESDDVTIERALGVLNGQALTQVEVREDSQTRFQFDLGCVLITRPAPKGSYSNEPVSQWMLYQPGGDVLAVRGDGSYSIHDRHTPRDEVCWSPLEV